MSANNPILNNPYLEPRRHYATNPAGELNYADVREGRRPFAGTLQTIPVRQIQGELLTVQELSDEYKSLVINRVRVEVHRWRNDGWPQTTRITRDLLQFWFANPDRSPHQGATRSPAVSTGRGRRGRGAWWLRGPR